MKNRCVHCEGKFGLVRHYAYYIMGLFVQRIAFCSRRCERSYEAARRMKHQAQQFQRWLHS